jgi:TPR repeat protein
LLVREFQLAFRPAPRALYLLGRCHRDGVGTKVDKHRAAELFRNAAFSTGGYPPAMNDLMVLIHTDLPVSFRSELFQKLRDGEIKSLEDALETFPPKVDTVSDAYELIDDLVADDGASGGKSSK